MIQFAMLHNVRASTNLETNKLISKNKTKQTKQKLSSSSVSIGLPTTPGYILYNSPPGTSTPGFTLSSGVLCLILWFW